MACFICKTEKLTPILNLGHQPPSDAFLKSEDLRKPEVTYPLNLVRCEVCSLVQLDYAIDPNILFRDYVYNTGTNNQLKVNFKSLVDAVVERFRLTGADLAIDIGSNDGTLLKNYLPYGVKILGIDPSSVSVIAIREGVPTIISFFNEATAQKVVAEHGKAKMITATNVFAHVADLDSFMKGVTTLLAPDGVFVSDSGYLLDLITELQYDSIYHEHLRYYSLKPLLRLFHDHGLEIFDVERIPNHGGSIRVFGGKKGAYPISPNVQTLLQLEEKNGLSAPETFSAFAHRVAQSRLSLQTIIFDIKREGKRIVGIGAPAKGNTLLNFCRFGPDSIDYLVEKSELKIGLFTPGSHIPVVDEAKMFEEQPEYGLLLSWNLAEELIKKLRAKGYRGKFIVPSETPTIL